jgi:hypothetical protein
VLRELAAEPAQITQLYDWLRPEHFARRCDGQVYAVMRDMAAAEMPVDPMTVCREAARCGLRVGQAELDSGTGVFAHVGALDLYGRAVLAQLGRAGIEVQAGARPAPGHAGRVDDAAALRLDCRDGRWNPEPWRSADLRLGRVPGPALALGNSGLSAVHLTVGAGQRRELEREAVS